MNRKKINPEIQVGLFMILGLLTLGTAILTIGKSDYLFEKKVTYFSYFENVNGLISGAKVILEGVPVGIVDKIELETQRRKIKVTLTVAKESQEWVRENSFVEIATLGVLGDKYITLNAGNPELPMMEEFSSIPVNTSQDLNHFLNKGDALLMNVNETIRQLTAILGDFKSNNRSQIFFQSLSSAAKNISQLTEKLNREVQLQEVNQSIKETYEILNKINNGTGTLGKLVNDPDLYDQVKSLLGGANRNRVIRNLIRKTIHDSEKGGSQALE